MAKVAEVCKGMLEIAIAWVACQLGVPHYALLDDWEQMQDQYYCLGDPAGVLRPTGVPEWA